MPEIRKLDTDTVERIAAGEVVKDPSSVVKELVENSLDAGASRIEIEIENGGRDLIRVSDDGEGMDEEDAVRAFDKHATSKIDDADDLRYVTSLGFRGEALPSIARVSQVEMVTRSEDADVGGTRVVVEDGGDERRTEEAGRGVGTTVEVSDLFYNTPARRSTLGSPKREFSKISDVVTKYALTHPGVGFELTHDVREVLNTPGSGNYVDPVFEVYGKEVANRAVEIDHGGGDEDGIDVEVEGIVVRPGVTRSSKSHVYTAVKGRALDDETVRRGVIEGYGTLLDGDRYPIAVVDVDLPAERVNVNVHPSKDEVRFDDEGAVKRVVRDTVRDALSTQDLSRVSEIEFSVDAEADGETESRFSSVEVIGQFRGLYLLCESEDDLLVVDQHAAHERVNYERLRDEFAGEDIPSVELESPETVNFTPTEKSVIEERSDLLSSLGFELEEFGGGTYRVRKVPAPLGRVEDKESLHDALDRIADGDEPREARDEILKDVACHPSLKAGDSLTKEKAEDLIDELGSCSEPFACPHGRPTVLSVNEREIAKGFGRDSVRMATDGVDGDDEDEDEGGGDV
ncbi:DNA mismatch repair endonuclease MutL [Halorutilales archaeon Cl-col2-1]